MKNHQKLLSVTVCFCFDDDAYDDIL